MLSINKCWAFNLKILFITFRALNGLIPSSLTDIIKTPMPQYNYDKSVSVF